MTTSSFSVTKLSLKFSTNCAGCGRMFRFESNDLADMDASRWPTKCEACCPVFIELHWEHEPTAYYVRGHVTPEQFTKAVEPYLGGEVARDLIMRTVEHTYARWIPTPHGDNDRVLREEPRKSRGCFAVTVVRP